MHSDPELQAAGTIAGDQDGTTVLLADPPPVDGASPATNEELDRNIRRLAFDRRKRAAVNTPKGRPIKLRCSLCPARNRYVREYKTEQGMRLLCVKCADVLRLDQIQKRSAMEKEQGPKAWQGVPSIISSEYGELYFETTGAKSKSP